MNFIDIVLGVVLLIGLYQGFKKGLLIEITGLIALVLGVYGAIHFSYLIGEYIEKYISSSSQYTEIVAFAVTFFIILILIAFVGKLLTKVLNLIALGFLNRLLGSLFGMLKMAIILSVVIIFFDKINANFELIDSATTQNTFIYKPIKNLGHSVFDWVLENKTILSQK